MGKKTKLIKIISTLSILTLFFTISSSLVIYAGNPPDQANSSMVVSPDQVPADGTTVATITVTLKDNLGTPLSGDSVTLSALGDPRAVFSPASAVLDAMGIATFSATSTMPGTDAISVTDTTTSTTLSSLGQVIFTSVSVPSTDTSNANCSKTYPSNAPNLYQVTAGQTSTTLFYAEPSSDFDGYTISYGTTSSADGYNITYSQGRVGSANKYTVSDLTPKTIYYFKIRANNGCATGPWSSVLSSSSQTLPEAGPSNFLTFGLIGAMLIVVGSSLVIKLR
jgi:hypothetical protein